MNDSSLADIVRWVNIDAPASAIWRVLTDPLLMQRWLLDEPVTITTNWVVGSPIRIAGDLNKVAFENKGTVLAFDPHRLLQYNYLSSLSALPDIIENYTRFTFTLDELAQHTVVVLNIRNFPTETIRQHLDFYWRTTLFSIKDIAEQQANSLL